MPSNGCSLTPLCETGWPPWAPISAPATVCGWAPTSSNGSACSTGRQVPEKSEPDVLDTLELVEGKRLSIVRTAIGLSAEPMVSDADGHWRRAVPGDGVSEALLRVLTAVPGLDTRGRFTLRSWTRQGATGERPM